MAVISQSRVTGDVEGGAPAGLSVKPGVVLRPQLLEPEIEEAAWGSRDVLPWLLELPNPQQRPQAWVHYRPVGAGSAPGGLRVVAVDTPYPLGVRPTAAQALAGFQAEEQAGLAVDAAQRLFPDAVGGAVSMVALTPMVLLAGHRPLAEVGALINLLGLRALAPWVTRLMTEGEPARQALWQRLLSLPAGEVRQLVQAALPSISVHRHPALLEAGRLALQFPGDAMALAPLLMPMVCLAPGEACTVPAGMLHACLRGTAVLVGAAGPTRLQAGLSSQYRDPAQLLACVDWTSGAPAVSALSPCHDGLGAAWQTPGWEIRLWQPEGHAIAIGEPACAAEASGAPVGGEWLLGLRGQAEIADKQNTWLLGCGQGLWLPTQPGRYHLCGRGRVLGIRQTGQAG